jgi:hypothetical protein
MQEVRKAVMNVTSRGARMVKQLVNRCDMEDWFYMIFYDFICYIHVFPIYIYNYINWYQHLFVQSYRNYEWDWLVLAKKSLAIFTPGAAKQRSCNAKGASGSTLAWLGRPETCTIVYTWHGSSRSYRCYQRKQWKHLGKPELYSDQNLTCRGCQRSKFHGEATSDRWIGSGKAWQSLRSREESLFWNPF